MADSDMQPFGILLHLLPGNNTMEPFWNYSIPDDRVELKLFEPGKNSSLWLHPVHFHEGVLRGKQTVNLWFSTSQSVCTYSTYTVQYTSLWKITYCIYSLCSFVTGEQAMNVTIVTHGRLITESSMSPS